jgi:hypothetical protein
MTAASYKWRTTSHFTLHNSGTEEFLIWLRNYLQRERGGEEEKEDFLGLMPIFLDVKSPGFHFEC